MYSFLFLDLHVRYKEYHKSVLKKAIIWLQWYWFNLKRITCYFQTQLHVDACLLYCKRLW